MYETFHSRFKLDERAEIDDARDMTRHDHVGRVALADRLPRIGAGLLQAEADLLVERIEVDHDQPDRVANFDDIARMLDPRVAHLADRQQAFDALFHFDERAEVLDLRHAPGD